MSSDDAGAAETGNKPIPKKPDWTDKVQAFAAFFVGIGAIFATWQYVFAPDKDRIAETQKFIERFESERYSSVRLDIDQIIESTAVELEKEAQRFEASGMGDFVGPVRDRAIASIVLENSEGQSAEPPRAIIEIVSFFGGVQVCIEEEICHSGTAHAFFDIYARSFWNEFEPVIEHTRKTSRPKFAERMKRYVEAIEE